MVLKKKDFSKEKPKKDEVIIIRQKGDYYPSIGEFKILNNGKEVIYLIDQYILIELKDVEQWWIGIPNSFLDKKYY